MILLYKVPNQANKSMKAGKLLTFLWIIKTHSKGFWDMNVVLFHALFSSYMGKHTNEIQTTLPAVF